MEVEHIAEEMDKVEYYQESYDFTKYFLKISLINQYLIFMNTNLGLKFNDQTMIRIVSTFMGNYMRKIPKETIKYCPKCENNLEEVIYDLYLVN